MKRAIEAAGRSISEDERSHPLVGAVLSDLDGNPLLEMARGEGGPGMHAEAGLLERARAERIDLSKCAVFSTLEPCVWRSRKHTPCAVQLENARLPLVYVGMIDPHLRICGRGESYLTYCAEVERFPPALRREIERLNQKWLEPKRKTLIWTVRTWDIDPPASRPRLPMLHLSQDRIVGGEGDVWISAGDLSWLKELQPALLRAVLDGRKVRILCNRPLPAELKSAAISLGLTLVEAKSPWPLRATLVGPNTDRVHLLVIDQSDIHEYGHPEDRKLIASLTQAFEERCGAATVGLLKIKALDKKQLLRCLSEHVPQYAGARLEFEEHPAEHLQPLPTALEEFKIARWDLLSRTIEKHSLPKYFTIPGSPWSCTPIVVESYPDDIKVVIDGAHRVYSSLRKAPLEVIVVKMPNHDHVPAFPRTWPEVKRSYDKLPRDARYYQYDAGQFRPIREAFRRATAT